MAVFLVVFVVGLTAVLWFRHSMTTARITSAAARPLGAVETYTYTGKSGGLYEQLSAMSMERHINLMINNGWEVVSQTGLPGHLRLGRTVAGAALTGGLSILAGGSRTSDRVTITYRRVQVPAPTQYVQSPQPSFGPLAGGFCNHCGSALVLGARFCGTCGATTEPQHVGESNPPADSSRAMDSGPPFGSDKALGAFVLTVLILAVIISVGAGLRRSPKLDRKNSAEELSGEELKKRISEWQDPDPMDLSAFCKSAPFDKSCPNHEQAARLLAKSAQAITTSGVSDDRDPKKCLQVVRSGGAVDDFGTTITGTLSNNCARDFSYVEISFKLFDNRGNVVGTALANQTNLRAGEKWKFTAFGTPAAHHDSIDEVIGY